MQHVIFCVLLCIFTNNIHVSVKNSSAEGTCLCNNKAIVPEKDLEMPIAKTNPLMT